jgi:hypothetical protein
MTLHEASTTRCLLAILAKETVYFFKHASFRKAPEIDTFNQDQRSRTFWPRVGNPTRHQINFLSCLIQARQGEYFGWGCFPHDL